jgi:hypothetical protein
MPDVVEQIGRTRFGCIRSHAPHGHLHAIGPRSGEPNTTRRALSGVDEAVRETRGLSRGREGGFRGGPSTPLRVLGGGAAVVVVLLLELFVAPCVANSYTKNAPLAKHRRGVMGPPEHPPPPLKRNASRTGSSTPDL